MQTASRTYQLVEARLHEDLEAFAVEQRRDGKSWNAISLELYVRTNVSVTSQTLRNWFGTTPTSRRRKASA